MGLRRRYIVWLSFIGRVIWGWEERIAWACPMHSSTERKSWNEMKFHVWEPDISEKWLQCGSWERKETASFASPGEADSIRRRVIASIGNPVFWRFARGANSSEISFFRNSRDFLIVAWFRPVVACSREIFGSSAPGWNSALKSAVRTPSFSFRMIGIETLIGKCLLWLNNIQE